MNPRQNQIKRTLSSGQGIEQIRGLLGSADGCGRGELAARVCQRFGFYDPAGREQRSGCLKALRELEAAGHFVLPAGRPGAERPSGPHGGPAVALPERCPATVGEVRGLTLVLVRTPEQRRLWNDLMGREHPQGAGPLVGRQLRYLLGSDHGWLGGVGFAAAALQLAERDAWMGWDRERRRDYLHHVVGMSRFLIRPSVQCRHLASKALALSGAALPGDFEQRYGYRPWLLESFVDTAHHAGTCYRAANWILVGHTRGRGRQDRHNASAKSVKAIYVYPLEHDFRKRMGLDPNGGRGALSVSDGLEGDAWAQHEFGGAPLGDARLSRRLVDVAAAKAQAPDRAFSGATQGEWAKVKAYYRLIDQPEESAVTMPGILAPHRERTLRRMMGQKVVLCVQDGSDLTYTNLDQCTGLGDMGRNQTGARGRGLHLHSTLAIAANGLPLGVLQAQCLAPGVPAPQEAADQRKKKTHVWIDHHRDLVQVARRMPQTHLVDVCDREADFFEMFAEQRQNPQVDLLVRAQHDRKITAGPERLFATVRQAPPQGHVQVSIARQSARPKKSKQQARPLRPGRHAQLTVRFMRIPLRPPAGQADQAPIDVWVIHAREEQAPDAKPVEWFLLTTMAITQLADAEQCLRWYCLRWRIEDWHRVLKSGCRIGHLAHDTAERLRRAIAINLVIAWRIMLMTLLGRDTPPLPPDILFSDVELRTLRAFAKKSRLKPPEHLEDAVRLVAKIGGYLGRNNDPPPGHQLLWQGYREFQLMCLGAALLAEDG